MKITRKQISKAIAKEVIERVVNIMQKDEFAGENMYTDGGRFTLAMDEQTLTLLKDFVGYNKKITTKELVDAMNVTALDINNDYRKRVMSQI